MEEHIMCTQYVETVLGPVSSDGLGVILPHEHFPHFFGERSKSAPSRKGEILCPPEGYAETLEKKQLRILGELKKNGVNTFVSLSMIGVGRMIPMMQKLSRATGIHVVVSTGFYVKEHHPQWLDEMDVDDVAELFTEELTEGILDTGSKAGIIKVGGGRELTEGEKKVFRAAVKASKRTGAAITTHSCSCIRRHFDFLVEAGANPERIYIGHADFGEDNSEQRYVAENGGKMIFTCWGIQHFVDQDVLEDRIVDLVEAGYSSSILLSIDYCFGPDTNRMALVSMEYECPDRTPGFLFRYVLPRLRKKGISEDHINQFIRDNPRGMILLPETLDQTVRQ